MRFFTTAKANLQLVGSILKSFLFYKFPYILYNFIPTIKKKLDQALEYSGHRSTKVLHCRQSCPFGPRSHTPQKRKKKKKIKMIEVVWPSSLIASLLVEIFLA